VCMTASRSLRICSGLEHTPECSDKHVRGAGLGHTSQEAEVGEINLTVSNSRCSQSEISDNEAD